MLRYKLRRSSSQAKVDGLPGVVALLGIAVVSCFLLASCSEGAATKPPVHAVSAQPTSEKGVKAPSAVHESPWRVSESPSLRELTVAVRMVPPEPIVASYKALARRHQSLKKILEVQSEGGFGSGFVVVHQKRTADEPRLYVITNQHVVGFAEEASIEFDGDARKWPGRVVYVDRDYDLAVLCLKWEESTVAGTSKVQPPVLAGFGLADQGARDEDAVVAAGYPGIAGEPSYQVTRGYVSNERLMLDVNGRKQLHVQHTAPIDPGSSGGPLLNEKGQVLGINTLKISGREGVGLAVPADAIRRALDHALELTDRPPSDHAEQQLEACRQLLNDLRSGSQQAVERGLSSRLTAEQGPLSLGLLPDDGTDWGLWFIISPEEVFLRALSLRVQKTLLPQGASGAGSLSCEMKGEKAHVVGGNKSRTLSFTLEQGRLKLVDAELIEGGTTSFLDPPRKSKKWTPALR